MARVTERMARDLQASLRGEATAETSPSGNPHRVGCIWFGNWRDNADTGSFGSEEKTDHNGMISKRPRFRIKRPIDAWFTIHPITTEARKKNCFELPRGTIPQGKKFASSYVLTKHRLHISQEKLNQRFEYRCRLPEDLIKKIQSMRRKNRV